MASVSYNSNGVVIKDGKLLTTREKNRKLCLLPGGGIERGETPKLALVRELKEELGIHVDENDLESWGEFSAPSSGRRTVRKTQLFLVKTWIGNPQPRGEVAELVWMDGHIASSLSLEWILKHRVIPELLKKKLIY